MKFKSIAFIVLAIMLLLAGCNTGGETADPAASADSGSGSTGTETGGEEADSAAGKELRIAFDTRPPSLDPHMSTAAATREVSRPIFEGLVALDSQYVPQPMLAESWDISEDGLTITFHLREGVLFHNGKEMTSEDVVASLDRWKGIATAGKANFADAAFTAADPYTVELKLPSPNSTAVTVLAGPTQSASIMPKEVIEAASASGITEFIGTGPFKVQEFVQDQYLTVTKFADYQPAPGEGNGLAGAKEALVETIVYEFVTDPSTRLSGLQAGQYDIATALSYDNYDMLEIDPNISRYAYETDFNTMIFNKQEGIFSDVKMRQAVLAALDMENILIAVHGNPFFYELDHGLASKAQVEWYSDAGRELYNQKNPEKAKQLLQEAGYNGEEVRLMTTRDIVTIYNSSIAIQQQLQEIGMNVKLEVYDWSALLEERNDPAIWDAFFTGWPTEPIPSNYVFLHSANGYPGWTDSSEIDRLVDEIKVAPSTEETKALFEQLQTEFYEYVPAIKYGNSMKFTAGRSNVTGIDFYYGLIPWGIDKQN